MKPLELLPMVRGWVLWFDPAVPGPLTDIVVGYTPTDDRITAQFTADGRLVSILFREVGQHEDRA